MWQLSIMFASRMSFSFETRLHIWQIRAAQRRLERLQFTLNFLWRVDSVLCRWVPLVSRLEVCVRLFISTGNAPVNTIKEQLLFGVRILWHAEELLRWHQNRKECSLNWDEQTQRFFQLLQNVESLNEMTCFKVLLCWTQQTFRLLFAAGRSIQHSSWRLTYRSYD